MRITVLGQGYVGLPLSIASAKAGHTVFGLDKNLQKIERLSAGYSTIEDISAQEVREVLESGNYFPTSDFGRIADSDVILICVPTPLTADRKPDLSILKDAIAVAAGLLQQGSLIVVESTIEPGTCRKTLIPLVESLSKLTNNQFDFAYSPERIDPVNKIWNISNTPKLVAGNTPDALRRATEFYSSFISSVIPCSTLEVAELAKLTENSFRLVNISLINEISDFCGQIGVSAREVIAAAATKPYGYMPFYPGLGAGGHCIPVDPLYLLSAAVAKNSSIKLIELASQINDSRTNFFVRLAINKIGTLINKRILIIGVSYKPNVSDVRETPVEKLVVELEHEGAKVFWHDELVGKWNSQISTPLSPDYDLAIVATLHDYIDLRKVGNIPILNTRDSI